MCFDTLGIGYQGDDGYQGDGIATKLLDGYQVLATKKCSALTKMLSTIYNHELLCISLSHSLQMVLTELCPAMGDSTSIGLSFCNDLVH